MSDVNNYDNDRIKNDSMHCPFYQLLLDNHYNLLSYLKHFPYSVHFLWMMYTSVVQVMTMSYILIPSENLPQSQKKKTFKKSSTQKIGRDPERAENSTIACTKD